MAFRNIVKCSFLVVLLLVTMLSCESGIPDINSEESRFVKIFDGSSFTGWEGDFDWFRIEDRAIVAGSLKEEIPHNLFLSTRSEYGDFELRLQVKLSGDEEHANAGIQFRSRRMTDSHEMIGYQADMGQRYWGCLYDESRRNRVLAEPDREKLGEVLNLGDWNNYVIRCKGQRIQLLINGYRTVDYEEPDRSIQQKGVIGLQIHGGPPAEAYYRDIRIREID